MAQIWQAIVDLCKNESVLVLGLLSAALTLGAAFGLHIMSDQNAAIMAFAQILVALIGRSSTVAKAKFQALANSKKS